MQPEALVECLDQIARLRALVDTLTKIPGQHRDEYLGQFADDDLIPNERRDGIRDTCDVIGHKLRDAARDATHPPCRTCGSPVRAVRLVPRPTDGDYRNGAHNDPDYDPKFSNPCTDPWHDTH